MLNQHDIGLMLGKERLEQNTSSNLKKHYYERHLEHGPCFLLVPSCMTSPLSPLAGVASTQMSPVSRAVLHLS